MSCLPDPEPVAVSGIFILCLPAGQKLDWKAQIKI